MNNIEKSSEEHEIQDYVHAPLNWDSMTDHHHSLCSTSTVGLILGCRVSSSMI